MVRRVSSKRPQSLTTNRATPTSRACGAGGPREGGLRREQTVALVSTARPGASSSGARPLDETVESVPTRQLAELDVGVRQLADRGQLDETPDAEGVGDGGAQPPPFSVPVPCGGALFLVVGAPLPPALPLLRVTGLTGVIRFTGVTGVTGVTGATGVTGTGRTRLSERPPELVGLVSVTVLAGELVGVDEACALATLDGFRVVA
jgi:hypothetical protein